MNEAPKNKSGWRIVRRIFVGVAIFATLIAIFYAEEDWRGKRAWENCKRELEAKGEILDWNAYIPPAVPDDQNFFKATKMQEWFVKIQSSLSNEFTARLLNTNTTAAILSEAAAKKYLAWSDQFEPDFNLIRDALKRSYARMDGDYSIPYKIPIPNFVAVRIVAQTLAQRAKCNLLLNQPHKALQDLTLLHDTCRLLLAAPTHKPMTLVAAMINVAVNGLYVGTIADGFQNHAWQEPQLVALQEQLAEINLTPFVLEALREEPVAVTRTAETDWIPKMFDATSHTTLKIKIVWWFWPHGWTYQNMVNVAMLELKRLNGFDLPNNSIAPHMIDQDFHNLNDFFSSKSPFKILARIAAPNFSKAEQTTAHTQTLINEAQIVCALERYKLANGNYPETLDALAPQFMEKIPHDIIGGAPLHYRRTENGKFILYSVGWNETDDGGKVVLTKNGSVDQKSGDWVWQYP